MAKADNQNGKALNPGQYYSMAQVRAELWTELKLKSYAITKRNTSAETDDQKTSLTQAFKRLLQIEQYFAFPGTDILQTLHSFIKNEEFQILRNSVKEILHLLASEDYRQDPDILTFGELLKRKGNKPTAHQKSKKRYFEVLFVDNISPKEEAIISNKLSMVRDAREHFIYQLVYAKSYQDALIALVANPNIQACVIRSEIPFQSPNAKGLLQPFIQDLLKENLSDVPEYDLG